MTPEGLRVKREAAPRTRVSVIHDFCRGNLKFDYACKFLGAPSAIRSVKADLDRGLLSPEHYSKYTNGR